MMQKSNAVEILNSQHTNLLTKQKSRAEKILDTGLRHTKDAESIFTTVFGVSPPGAMPVAGFIISFQKKEVNI